MAFISFVKRLFKARPAVCRQCRFADEKSLDDKGFLACCVDPPLATFDGKDYISGRPFTLNEAPACSRARSK